MSRAANKTAFVPAWLVGEFLGTFLLVFFGCGSVAAAVLTGAQVGIFQVAIVWGVVIAIAIHLTGSLSGAHLNPAVTLAFAAWTDFPWARVPRYVAAQFGGAFAAAMVLYGLFGGALAAYEAAHGLVRGAPGSEASAMVFGEYFPNPGGQPLTEAARATMPFWRAFLAEALGTGLLAVAILGLSDEKNRARSPALTPVLIGLTVTILISVLAPLTQACFNPARDLAPRLLSALAGWGSLPFEVNGSGWLTVYVMAPCIGALTGGAVWRWWLAPHYAA